MLGRSGRWAAAGGWICWSPFGSDLVDMWWCGFLFWGGGEALQTIAYHGEGVISRGILHIGLEDEGFDIAKV